MNSDGFVTLSLLLGSFAALWWLIVYVRPLVARSRFTLRLQEVEFDIEDAVLRGEVDPRDAAYTDFNRYIRSLSREPERYGLTEAMALQRTLKEMGVEVDELLPSVTYAAMAPSGRLAMNRAEQAAKSALADYLVDGSKFWPVLSAGRWGYRRLSQNETGRRHAAPTAEGLTPGHLAASYREAASRGVQFAGLGRQTPARA